MFQISPLFFSPKKELFSWIYLLKKTPRKTKILIYPVWKSVWKIWDRIFELIQIEVQCRTYFKVFFPQEAGAFQNDIEKEPQKPHLKFKKYVHYIFAENICSACSPMQVAVFFKNVLTLEKTNQIFWLWK